MKFLSLLLAGTIGVAWSFSASAQSVLVNGSFETNGGDNSSTAPPWVVTGNDAFQTDQGVTDGSFAAAFNPGQSTPNGVISQTFTTVALQLYTVTFDWGNFGADVVQRLQIEVVDGTSGPELITPGSGTVSTVSGATILQNTSVFQIEDSTGSGFSPINGAAPNGEFSLFSFTFTAQSSSSTIIFTDIGLGTMSSDGMLDNIVVVPEPSTWAMMAVGALIISGLSRFRRRVI